MSNTRYLELSSRWRNRAEWPLPGQFEVPISQSGTKGKLDALDPVSLAAPIHSWCSNVFDRLAPGALAITVIVASVGASSPGTFIVTAPTGRLQPILDYYIGAIALNTSLMPPAGGQAQRIAMYKFLGDFGGGLDHAEISLEFPYSSLFAVGNMISITDPTSFLSTTNPDIFVPAGRLGSNAYPGCLLYNETLSAATNTSVYRPIINYDFYTHMLEINTSAAVGGPVVGWSSTDCFSIRCDEIPCLIGLSGAATTSTVVLPAGASTVNDFYVGDFIYVPILTSAPVIPPPQGEFRRIVDYDGATATVAPPFSVAPAGITVQVLCFSYDNAVPFNYTGSLVSQSQMVCYEIELINLILPNQTLNVGRGSRTAFYQYVYVELQNVSAANAGHPGVIYSNNPNAVRMLFRATIDDTQNPIISTFNKIDGDGMTQTVKFKPNDNLRFSVRMSNGEVFQTLVQDTVSPVPPNDLIQVTALFSLKRL